MKILLVGTGYMAKEYAKVLKALKISFDVVGRGSENCKVFKEMHNEINVYEGGIEKFKPSSAYTHAIISSNVDFLSAHTKTLIDLGIKNILLEKPGGANLNEITTLAASVKDKNADVTIAYNRRFYASVLKAKDMIEQDGGIRSFNFEFTEWTSSFDDLPDNSIVKQNLLYANSTHVIDLAFYLGGFPKTMKCFSAGKLNWHSKAIYSGAGVSDKDALFSYQANWQGPGRWSVEMITDKHRFIFRPMEQLQIQKLNSVKAEICEIDDSFDKEYKPGVYKQTEAFLFDPSNLDLLKIDQQALNCLYFQNILNGN